MLVSKNEGITLDAITDGLEGNVKTMSEHTRRLVQAGLLEKKYKGRQVTHSLSPYGKVFARFIKTF
jgi:predicted transcriptional regulator